MAEKKKTRSELKREAIIDAAKTAFQQFGVQGTSMDKLAEMAQVSKRTVYNHFATKQELVMYLLTDLWTRAMIQVEVPYQRDTPLEEQLTQLIDAEMALITSQEYIDLARMAFGHFFYHPEELKKEIEKISEQETIFHRWIRSASEDGRLNVEDLELATDQIHSLIKGCCFWPQILGVEPIPDTNRVKIITEQTIHMFLSRYQSA